ncbi:hypothetical protein VPNG_08671 [Cytospora leucostoma]|uniref:Uncharacterized protein n=1 Tax=Cytospora leucostoma TaxID=1230097 RepID=A0A423W3D4_9PEZI|nr:hypothetical protein VPNG_08671 [Cytospora leucostoma]
MVPRPQDSRAVRPAAHFPQLNGPSHESTIAPSDGLKQNGTKSSTNSSSEDKKPCPKQDINLLGVGSQFWEGNE